MGRVARRIGRGARARIDFSTGLNGVDLSRLGAVAASVILRRLRAAAVEVDERLRALVDAAALLSANGAALLALVTGGDDVRVPAVALIFAVFCAALGGLVALLAQRALLPVQIATDGSAIPPGEQVTRHAAVLGAKLRMESVASGALLLAFAGVAVYPLLAWLL
jgi:hypothetical protein